MKQNPQGIEFSICKFINFIVIFSVLHDRLSFIIRIKTFYLNVVNAIKVDLS